METLLDYLALERVQAAVEVDALVVVVAQVVVVAVVVQVVVEVVVAEVLEYEYHLSILSLSQFL